MQNTPEQIEQEENIAEIKESLNVSAQKIYELTKKLLALKGMNIHDTDIIELDKRTIKNELTEVISKITISDQFDLFNEALSKNLKKLRSKKHKDTFSSNAFLLFSQVIGDLIRKSNAKQTLDTTLNSSNIAANAVLNLD